MFKFYKNRIYKRYKDEVWGKLICSGVFSYNKRAVLLNYKATILKNYIRLRTKFNYFKVGFLKRLRLAVFDFRFYRRSFKLLNLQLLKQFYRITSSSSIIRIPKNLSMPSRILAGRFRSSFLYDKFICRRFKYIKRTTPYRFLNSKNKLNSVRRYSNHFNKIKSLISLRFSLLFVKTSPAILRAYGLFYLSFKNFNFIPFSPFFKNRSAVALKLVSFLRLNNFRFLVKKKLKLRNRRSFFYSVHIASPKKKDKKWSLFALKSIYYRKLALFYGFKKPTSLLKLYKSSLNIFGRNDFSTFLMLEGRLEIFLQRLNLFPSVYFIKKFITHRNVFVNGVPVSYSSFILNFNEVVSINKKYLKSVYFFLKRSLRLKKVLLNHPSFIEVDYKIFVAMLVRTPSVLDMTLPVSFDLYTKFLSLNR